MLYWVKTLVEPSMADSDPTTASNTSKRRDEIERKKQKIAELKRAREERSKALQATVQAETTNHVARRKELEDLVASLVGERARKEMDVPTMEAVAPTVAHTLTLDADIPSGQPFMVLKDPPKLVMTSMVIFESSPSEKVFYEKEIQTADSSFQMDDQKEDEAAQALTAAEVAASVAPAAEEADPEPEPEKQREFDEHEREMIMHSEQFQDFFERSTKLVERALVSKYDTLVDYTLNDDFIGNVETDKDVKLATSFFDERWTKNRSVTDLSWSARHPELVLASYNKNQSSINDPDGVVLIWNAHVPDRPEFIFHAQSDVTTACFSEFHPNLVIGGTYSGQILIWDNRQKSMPVLKTPLSAAGHTHPVYSMSIVGTQNAHNLLTCSTDGIVCSWQLDMLAQPQELLELAHSPMDSTNLRPTNEISVTTFGFPANETTTFWVGTEEGSVYQANRYDRSGGKAGINSLDTYMAHDGMITSLHFHPLHGSIDFSDLFLTSSVDWTVKLWKAKSPLKAGNPAGIAPPAANTITPLYSFDESDDYVYDAKWSPTHPALFACVDGSGILDIYDLNSDLEEPRGTVAVGSNKVALNKIAWEKAGTRIAVGSSDGTVHVYDLGEMGVPKGEDWAAFQKIVGEMGGQH